MSGELVPGAASEPTRHDEVLQALWRVRDPELGMSLVKLGLIYDIEIDETDVVVSMTLTTHGCPLAGPLTEAARRVVSELPWVTSVVVRLVWEPAWTPERIMR